MFADDTKVFKDINDIEDNKILQNDIQDKWLLRFLPDKCKVLSAGKQKTQQYKYTLCNTELQYSNNEKDIGVLGTDHLT